MAKSFTRLCLLLFYFYPITRQKVPYKVTGTRNEMLVGYSFQNITKANMGTCLARCLASCLCMAFQICDEDQLCQLCSTNSRLSPGARRQQEGCSSFVFEKELSQITSQPQCDHSCYRDTNCCLISNPCLNGGTCEQSPPEDHTKRFRCKCPPGYTGNLCEQLIKSCQGYTNGTRAPGKYKIFDDDRQLYEVFCDFDKDSNWTWTLIQSFELDKVNTFRKSFYTNAPTKESSPSWTSYRLSKTKMKSIQDDSKKWRITCQYEVDNLAHHTDYVRGTNEQLDILSFNGEKCVKVEYIDIRGTNCGESCTAYFMQAHNNAVVNYLYPLHSDSTQSGASRCSFQSIDRTICLLNRGGYEDNFGYFACSNTKHRCSATGRSTTQTWFGGH